MNKIIHMNHSPKLDEQETPGADNAAKVIREFITRFGRDEFAAVNRAYPDNADFVAELAKRLDDDAADDYADALREARYGKGL